MHLAARVSIETTLGADRHVAAWLVRLMTDAEVDQVTRLVLPLHEAQLRSTVADVLQRTATRIRPDDVDDSDSDSDC